MTPVTPETVVAVRKAAEALRAQGFQVDEWVPPGLERIWRLWWNLFGRAGQMAFAPAIKDREGELSPTFQDFRAHGIRAWIERGRTAQHASRTRCDSRRVPREDGGVFRFCFVLPARCPRFAMANANGSSTASASNTSRLSVLRDRSIFWNACGGDSG